MMYVYVAPESFYCPLSPLPCRNIPNDLVRSELKPKRDEASFYLIDSINAGASFSWSTTAVLLIVSRRRDSPLAPSAGTLPPRHRWPLALRTTHTHTHLYIIIAAHLSFTHTDMYPSLLDANEWDTDLFSAVRRTSRYRRRKWLQTATLRADYACG